VTRWFTLLGLTLSLGACTQSPEGVRVAHYDDREIQGSLGRHTVYAHETVWGIAQNYQVSMRDVIEANQLSAPFTLPVGVRLVIPAPREYTVKRGDTLLRVSRMFDTTTTELARLNKLDVSYKVVAGQALKIPGHGMGVNIPEAAQSEKIQTASVVTPVYSETLSPSVISTSMPSAERKATTPSMMKNKVAAVSGYESPKGSGELVFMRPVSGNIISGYGPAKDGRHNDGINIKAPKGAGVRAAERGQVVYVGSQIEGYGQLVLIKHAKGYITAYAHLERVLVKKGDVVSRGQTIGTVGSSGHVGSPQLHFEVRKGRDVLDPQRILGNRV